MLSKERLGEIWERCEAATPGPWKAVSDCSQFAVYSPIADMDVVTSQCREYLAIQRGHLGSLRTNAEFIAHARTDIPDLLSEIDRLRSALSFYADEKNWHESDVWLNIPARRDGGARARDALGGGG